MGDKPLLEGPTAWSVKRLALAWDCSSSAIYKMIDDGTLQVFHIGRRGIRISEQEKRRCENRIAHPTATEISPSATEKVTPLPTSAMKLVSVGVRG